MSTSTQNTQNTEVKRSSWNIALKQWNESNTNKVLGKTGKPKFIIPKKNTPEFEAVKKISDEIKASQPPKSKRKTTTTESPSEFVNDLTKVLIQVLPKKSRAKTKTKVQYEGVVEAPQKEVEPTPTTTPNVDQREYDLDTILKMLNSMKTK